MSKRAQILHLLRKGVKRSRICEIVHCRYQTVVNAEYYLDYVPGMHNDSSKPSDVTEATLVIPKQEVKLHEERTLIYKE